MLRCILVVLLLGFASLVAQEIVRVPAFDTDKVEASYVVSLPDGYTGSRSWPVILDFHGAIAPARKGAEVTRSRIWKAVVDRVPVIVVGLNGRTRAWGTIKGRNDDVAFALHVMEEVAKRYSIDPNRRYLAGFSSGSDFLCQSDLQKKAPFAASLVMCPGPPNVVGLRNGELLAKKEHPFLFATGEEDYIRKAGAWQAFVTLDEAGGRTCYREVPGVGHVFFPPDEYARLFAELERLARGDVSERPVQSAREALGRGDELLASTLLAGVSKPAAEELLSSIEKRGHELVAHADAVDAQLETGRAFEAWWAIKTRFHRLPALAARADKELRELEGKGRRELYRARRQWFRSRKPPAEGAAGSKDGSSDSGSSTGKPKAGQGRWAFDHYVGYEELTSLVKDLSDRFPGRARLRSMGKSVEGRDLWVLTITDMSERSPDSKPAVYIQGGLHGNEISSVTTALFNAWLCAANPGRRRGIDRLMRDVTLYIAPAVNPDGVAHYTTEPHSHWRPRFNYRPFDSDGDGKVDEDGFDDLNGDGEIGLMYRPDPEGAYIVRGDRLVRGKGGPTYTLVGREGLDDDGDGRFSEDQPGGVDLNRNFPVGWTGPRRRFGGSTGAHALSEPETQAIVGFVEAHRNIALFLDYHNAARCLFYWTAKDATGDHALFQSVAGRAEKTLGYAPKPLDHAGAGLSAAWAYGQLGIPAFILELEATRGDEESYFAETWKGEAFMPPRPFDHPQLGRILLGNEYKKVPKRNPHPSDITWQADRVWQWLARELRELPKIELVQPRIATTEHGFVVTGAVRNAGHQPTDTERAIGQGRAFPVTLTADGARISGSTELGSLAPGQQRAFRVELSQPQADVTLAVGHPRGGIVKLEVRRGRRPTISVRTDYDILEGYAVPDAARSAHNEHYVNGETDAERGPAFELTHDKGVLRVAVLLGEWKDARHRVPVAAFEDAFFSKGSYTGRSFTGQPVYGSLHDFYQEMSYGRMAVTGRVFDWVELSGAYTEYEGASFGSSIVSDRITEAILARDGADALDGFDGYVFVWAGNAVRRTSALWPMRIRLKERPGAAAFKMGEFHKGEFAAIGVACHEMGHTFGVNDKYGLGATPNPLGPWCLMGKGTHGGPPSGRHRPFHLCAWCKMVIGWVRPVVIDPATDQKLALRPILYGPRECYRVLLKPDGSEYLLLENRRREGAFTDLPSPGLAILRVGPNDKPASPQTRLKLLPAHGLLPLRRGVIAAPERVSWPQDGRAEITVDGVRLHHIRLVDDVIHLRVSTAR